MSTKDTTNMIYLDYAAATPLDPQVRDAMRAYDDAHFANAFSTHTLGRESKRLLEDARFGIAQHLGVQSNECHITNGATDAMTKAIYGVINPLLERGVAYSDMHIVMSAIEHSTARACIEAFARRGISISTVGVTDDGVIDLKQLEEALRDNTILVVTMMVNNELGTIQPIRDIRKIIDTRYATGDRRPLVVTDASQAPLCLPVRPHDLGADLVVLDAAKLYGPKRCGLLYVDQKVEFSSLCGLFKKMPSEGTPDVAKAIGFRTAYDIAEKHRENDISQWRELKTYLIDALQQRFPDVRVHGAVEKSIPSIVNLSFPNVEGEFLAAQLNNAGIAVSTKSACLAEGGEGSYVVAALDPERANNSFRISFGRNTTQDDLDVLVSTLAEHVSRNT